MDAVVSALMSVVDEEDWEKAGLFDPPTMNLNYGHLSDQELLSLESMLPLVSSSPCRKGLPPFAKPTPGCSARVPTVCNIDRGILLRPDDGIKPPCGSSDLSIPKTAPCRFTSKKLWPPNQTHEKWFWGTILAWRK
jgi:hypothetical protein